MLKLRQRVGQLTFSEVQLSELTSSERSISARNLLSAGEFAQSQSHSKERPSSQPTSPIEDQLEIQVRVRLVLDWSSIKVFFLLFWLLLLQLEDDNFR